MASPDSGTLCAAPAEVPTDIATTPDLPPFNPYAAPEQIFECLPDGLPTTPAVAPEHAYHEKANALPLLPAAAECLEPGVKSFWTTMSTSRSLDVKLPSECAAIICWSRIPRLTGTTLMELLRYYDQLTSSSDSEVSAMLMEGFTTTLSAVEWVEDDSSPLMPGSLTCDVVVWYTT